MKLLFGAFFKALEAKIQNANDNHFAKKNKLCLVSFFEMMVQNLFFFPDEELNMPLVLLLAFFLRNKRGLRPPTEYIKRSGEKYKVKQSTKQAKRAS